jgi:hypothetical protein
MDISVNVKIDGKQTGLMGMSLEELNEKPVIKKKRKKRKKIPKIDQAIQNATKKRSEWITEEV